ncbi:hypothetical protein SS1G_14047 [Sclerotinia sclerotiorum 1980 UF-70]|uniref:Zn(2)-C6 fungal-type domain-containing protein n=1 Tax=Sclerotinia sclerotiorum (strain ATCC 18683 / 1980 / Ss-1) TaxID=665079 RepID=A7F8W6_SCLS1|nr:hypothetical protein SS1G_14047 [Sclerotinia sclerotiorum 1980 UF-70]EDN99187.1 hypothetical protein SS1G_14047 [Sclerotinia sclerotiorum 1980 UF-70]
MTMGRETGMDLTMETNGSEASSSMVIGTHDNSNTTPLNSKRQRLEKSRIENSYPRKRALRACQVCRARKTKCNNEKPVCGCCQALGAQLDFASQIIVERLDQVLQKLDEREVDSAETLRRISQELGTFQSEKVSLRSRWQAPATNGEGLGSERDHELQLDENMLTPSARTSPDAVLDWPVFESQYPTGFITRHLFDQNFFDDSRPEESEHDVSQPSAFINEEAVPQLVEIFLTRVHTKSPILDPKTAREFGFKIALEGLQWDASSCLVLIMCALGCVSQPLGDSHNRILPDNRMETSRSVLGEQDLSLGSAYFTAARKRIGLLKPSVIATQCIFLCGVYEMYMVHPLRAWNFFADASSNFFMYLKCEESHFGGDISRTKSPETQCIEASLYWSCYKSMCELRTEVPLPPSVLSQVNYAHSLPEPPTSFASVNDSRQEVSEVGFEILQEQAWHASLPEQIQFNDSIETDHELRFTLRTRAMEVKAWLYRPFLYYIIHQIIHQSSSKVPERVRQLAQKAIDGSIHWILLRHNRHRHHGSWFVGRLILSSALSILAAVKAKLRLDSLDNWKEIVLEAITTMKFWADESSDFAVGSVVLEKLFSQLLDISND